MLSQLRTRLLLSTLVTISIVGGLSTFIFVERRNLNAHVLRLAQLEQTTGLARELSLYVQYNAHDTNAYTLGHLEHRQEFDEHADRFATTVATLQQRIDADLIEEDEQADLDQVNQLRSAYDRAAQALFVAADANRATPSGANQARQDAAWEEADQLGDQLDEASQMLATHINADVQTAEAQLTERNRQMIALVIGLGSVVSALILLIQWTASRAVGAPLRALLAGVQGVAAGALHTRVAVRSQDEIGTLATAFNAMTARLQQQTHDLQSQYDTARAAQEAAEAARAEVVAQLATIEAQRNAIREMSVPILPLTDTAFVMPLVGALDSARIQMLQERALQLIEHSTARHLIVDITGVPVIDTLVAHGLLQMVQAARLLGAEAVLVGIRPEVAQTIVGLGIHFQSVVTRSSLQSGIAYALQGH